MNKDLKELLYKAKQISEFGADGKQHARFFNQFEAKALLNHIDQLQNNWNELKKSIKKRIKDYEKHLKQGEEPTSEYEASIKRDREFLKQMQDLEEGKDE